MGGGVPKVLRLVAGRPMVSIVVGILRDAGVSPICVVVGSHSADVREALGPGVLYAVQQEPKGSGDAAAAAASVLEGLGIEDTIVACGDSPLFSVETVRRLLDEHRRSGAVVTLTSALLDDPRGYGRIIRNQAGGVAAIVEEAEASEAVRATREVNGGLYAFKSKWLWSSLAAADAGPDEFVLTQIVQDAASSGKHVAAVECDPAEVAGVNTPEQLLAAERTLLSRA